jgi:hypothetical protein
MEYADPAAQQFLARVSALFLGHSVAFNAPQADQLRTRPPDKRIEPATTYDLSQN